MHPTPIQYLAQARLADLHRQAQCNALARAARSSRSQQQSTHPAPGLLAVVTRWAHRPGPAPRRL